jgi:hypothetical protein
MMTTKLGRRVAFSWLGAFTSVLPDMPASIAECGAAALSHLVGLPARVNADGAAVWFVRPIWAGSVPDRRPGAFHSAERSHPASAARGRDRRAMKGIVFNLLEEVVRREYGEDVWDQLLDAATLDGSYTSLGSYPDGHMLQLVAAASAALGVPPGDVVRWFGRKALPLLAERYPQFFQEHTSTRSFLLTLNHIIHPEVRKIYPGADVPVFDFDPSPGEDGLLMGYHSARRLCALAEGFIEGAAAHFGETVELHQPTCMLRGDEKCLIEISFKRCAA